ncbi:ABC transporter substrate-binding protein [Nocardioides caricicola]|uniref:ABC transporter substrate-binding protein n=1 Tax=Nocardioides caricicola TaxID=634770 RepID=A0ABW0N7Y3_9ACTN
MKQVGNRRGRLAAIALIGVASLTLASCASSDGDSEGGTGDSKETTDLGEKNPATGEPVKIGVTADEPDDARLTGYRATTEYINEYLGGLNGHPIELVECATKNTPAGGTACGVQFGQEDVAAVLAPNIGVSLSVYKPLEGSGIPYITQLTADVDVLGSDEAFVLFNPLGLGSATIAVAKDEGVKSAAFVMPDLPSTTGPVKELAEPQYEAAGLELAIVPIPLQVADPTAAIQQAISDGAGQLVFFGETEFVTTGIKTAKQLGFDGPLITQVSGFPEDQIASIPGGLEGVIVLGSTTLDESDEDRKLYNTVVETYADGAPVDDIFTTAAFQVELALQKALALTPDSGADAASVMDALQNMDRPVPLPLGGGMTFQCGADVIAVLPGVCVATTLRSNLDADGNAVSEEVLTSADAM